MIINISADAEELGISAAKFVAHKLNDAIEANGEARIVVSTGSSQFEVLNALSKAKVDWHKIELFHLDEYLNLPITHKASFRKYLRDRFLSLVDIKKFYAVEVDGDVNHNIEILTREIRNKPIDVGLIGIGENAHIAFNDPPADFNIKEAYQILKLNEQCKRQQVNEGWFNSIEEVPDRAVSMSVWQIMQCKTIVSCVPHKAKSNAVFKTLSSKLTNKVPSTILKQHSDFHLYLDYNSSSEVIVF
ncbi:MAG: 6-phosphogluconolactonase [Ginsengibacter sp.]